MRPMLPAMLVLALGACSSTPPTRLHTLLPAEAAAAAAPAALPVNPAWELLPVTIPVAVSQPQMVVRLADDTLAALEQDRWIAPLADELRAAVAQRIVRANLAPGATPPWRIEIEVQRFEAIVGRSARIDAQWALAQAGNPVALRCGASFEQPVGAGIPALAAGHRAVAALLGDAVAASLRAALAGAPSC